MTEAEKAENVRAANAALASMRGAGARWWSFSVSHTTLDLVVGDPMGTDNVALSLPACRYLTGPVNWPNQQIEVLFVPESNSIVIQDESVGFRAEGAGLFLWRRNYDLWSYHGLWLGRGAQSGRPIEEVTQGLKQRLARYYAGHVSHDELMYDVNAFLWYALPVAGESAANMDDHAG